ncbi:MAG: hypothetical protein ACRDRE_14155 [Pseudonocardiaceae bacterium]
MTDQAPFTDTLDGSREPEIVIVRICTCSTVSLRDGDIVGDTVSLTPTEATPLLDAISAAFVPGTTEPPPDCLSCLDCLGSLVTGPRPAPFGELT